MIVCLYYCLRYPACKVAVLYCHLCSVWLHQTFPHYLTNGTIFGTKLLHVKYVICFSLKFCPKYLSFLKEFSEIFSYRHKELRVKCPLFLFSFNETWIFSRDFQKILMYHIWWKSVQWERSCSVRTKGRQADRHDEANSSLFAILRARLKAVMFMTFWILDLQSDLCSPCFKLESCMRLYHSHARYMS